MAESKSEYLVKLLFSMLGFQPEQPVLERLGIYATLLHRELTKQRITGELTLEGIILKQFYDSLYPLKFAPLDKHSKVLDLGTGGGLPGLPLAIVVSEWQITLADANQKKCQFLDGAIRELGLSRASVVCERVELLGRDACYREQYDCVVSKAVAEIAVLAELALPLLVHGGVAYFYKGSRGESEAAQGERAVELCGGKFEKSWKYLLDAGEERSLFAYKKVRLTPERYPRRVGVPAKRPLGKMPGTDNSTVLKES